MQSHQTHDPGTGENFGRPTKRIINRDGSFNVVRTHTHFGFNDLYQYLIDLKWSRFLLLFVTVYLGLNLFFTVAFYLIGIEHLLGVHPEPGLHAFLDTFFFSVQTFTTVGYGNMSPDGVASNALAAFEATLGWIMFALSTGLLYGRFARPTARLYFGRHALITPLNGRQTLQVRVANRRANTMVETEARIMLVLSDKQLHHRRQYFDLKLERHSIFFFALNWTLVHVIDEESPFFGKSAAELEMLNAEVLVLLKGYDDTFNQTVHARYSYRFDEIRWNERFKMAYYPDEKGNVILDLDLLDVTEPITEQELHQPRAV